MAELEEQLRNAGAELLHPPADAEELLRLLDDAESLLAMVEQSPQQSVSLSLYPIMKALVANQLFQHADKDVKVHVASCISEITRITAPTTPYNDDLMKRFFAMIVEIFEDLDDFSSPCYSKKASILQMIAKVRSCLLMLDLECYDLILAMFHHFLNKTRENYSNQVFTSMETIMALILDDSEYISSDLAAYLLDSVKKSSKEAFPARFKLAKRVIRNCCANLKPCLVEIFQSKVVSLADLSKFAIKIYKEMTVLNDELDAPEECKGVEKTESRACLAENGHGTVQSLKFITGDGILETADKLQHCGTSKSESASRISKLNLMNANTGKSNLSSEESLKRNQLPSFDLNASPISDKKPDLAPKKRGRPPGSKKQVILSKPIPLNEERNSKLNSSLDMSASVISDNKPGATPKRRGRPPGSKNQMKKKDEDKAIFEQNLQLQLRGITQKTIKGELLKELQTNKRKHKKRDAAESNEEEQLGEEVVNSRVKVWWPMDERYYCGIVRAFDPVKKKHEILYDDGDMEVLFLKDERWKFVHGDSSSEDENQHHPSRSEISLKRRRKARSGSPSKHQKAARARRKSSTSASRNDEKKKQGHDNMQSTHGRTREGFKFVGKKMRMGSAAKLDETSLPEEWSNKQPECRVAHNPENDISNRDGAEIHGGWEESGFASMPDNLKDFVEDMYDDSLDLHNFDDFLHDESTISEKKCYESDSDKQGDDFTISEKIGFDSDSDKTR